jgi:hypothetical protein
MRTGSVSGRGISIGATQTFRKGLFCCGQIVVTSHNGKGFQSLEALLLLVDVRGFEPLTS